jgi:ribonuclease E
VADRIDENTPETGQETVGDTFRAETVPAPGADQADDGSRPEPDLGTAPGADTTAAAEAGVDATGGPEAGGGAGGGPGTGADGAGGPEPAADTAVPVLDDDTTGARPADSVDEPDDIDEEADGEAEATAAAVAAARGSASAEVAGPPAAEPSRNDPFSAPAASRTAPEDREEPADDGSDVPRFAAPFSSPEPTTVTARPRRRATRPALPADPDSVEPAPAQAAPVIPAFVSFVAPPEPDAVTPRRRSRRAQAESPGEPDEQAAEPAARDTEAPAPRRSRSRRRETVETPAEEDVDTPVAVGEAAGSAEPDADERTAEDDDRDGDDSGTGGSRRRRRGRRGRGRGRTGEDGVDTEDGTDADDGADDTAEDDTAEDAEPTAAEPEGAEDEDESDDGEQGSGSSTRRRRRRRRRGESSGTAAAEDTPDDDDRPERAGRNGRTSSEDDVRGVAGSTRLEAKRQRRREGRDGGRRRAPILSESEFLARREAVDRAMVIRQQGERTQIAVLEDDVLVEHYVTQAQATSFAGNVYLGRVQNVLPSMEAAFVDIGKGRNAVLYAGEVNWDAAGLSGKSRSIETALKSGDKVLVQVTKDPIGHKGARLTQQVNLPGRFLVYVPGGSMTGISRKLPDRERTRLKDILKKIVPEDAGVIIRTAAEGATEEELTRDVARLQAQWEVIQTKAGSTSSAPTLLYGEPDLAIRVIRDVFNEDFKRLVVQGDDAWDTVEAYVAHVSPELSQRLQRYTGTGDVFADLRIDEQLMKALDRKVWLPSGGSLVIDRTEAMTVVDVNTGKFVGSGGNLEQTVTRNNIEAAEEIVRQLRLRDIGGMIVIDFIDMVLESNRDLVLRRLTECLGRDRTKHQVAEVTSLGLVQMTRKRVGQGLLEVFSEPCEHCRGRGVVVHLDPVDDRRRSGGNGGSSGGSSSGGSAAGGSGAANGSSRNRDRDRGSDSGRDAKPARQDATGRDTSGRDTSGRDTSGRDTSGRDTSGRTGSGPESTVQVAADVVPDAGDGEAGAGEDVRSEGGRGRRSRGRRGRGQSGEARAAEDAAVLAGARGGDPGTGEEPLDQPADPAVPAADGAGRREPAAEAPAPDVDEPGEPDAGAPAEPLAGTPDELPVEDAGSAGTGHPAPVPAGRPEHVDQQPDTVDGRLQTDHRAEQPAAVVPGPAEPAFPDGTAAEPTPADGPVLPVARPRRRRAASRPAGPPA